MDGQGDFNKCSIRKRKRLIFDSELRHSMYNFPKLLLKKQKNALEIYLFQIVVCGVPVHTCYILITILNPKSNFFLK